MFNPGLAPFGKQLVKLSSLLFFISHYENSESPFIISGQV